MTGPQYLPQAEAAALCSVSKDTLRRWRRDGKLPNSRERDDGVVEVAVADLVAVGALDPLAANSDVTEIATRSRTERDLIALREELAVARAELAHLHETLRRRDDEVTFLRGLVATCKAAA